MTFWNNLKKPFFVLAPMADVTDPAFRRIVTKYGKPDVLWTEFVSADGLAHPVAREKLIKDLAYVETERPIVAQLFSSNPEKMRIAARICAELGFDGIDINMGCPDRTIEHQGAGASLMKTPEIAGQIIQATKDGINDAGKNIPVSVKTRVGYNKIEIDTWIPFLLKQDITVLTVHARTRKELSLVPARWEHIREVVRLRNKLAPQTLIIGNGDVTDMTDAREKSRSSDADGVMIGRAIFGNPWLFADEDKTQKTKSLQSVVKNILFRFGLIKKNKYWLDVKPTRPLAEKLHVMVEHAHLFEELLPRKNFSIMKKHFKAYVHGFDRAKELRLKLMETSTAREVETIVDEFLNKC